MVARPELQKPCGAIRIEGQDLPERIFVLYGMDGQFHAFRNRYTLMRRRLDPVSGSATIHCGGLHGLTFDYSGHVISGSAKKPLKKYKVEMNKCKLIVWLD
jgi:nitrite reductase/ring-hydroxylating ferredoxin subunit